jgi:small subunit ribosomal protein S16
MVKIRLKRLGATKRPFYRVIVADSRSPRDGRFIEQIGKYHPLEDPSLIEIDDDRALYWLNHGAQPTEQVRNLLKIQGVWATFESSRASSAKAKGKAKTPSGKKASAEAAPAATADVG